MTLFFLSGLAVTQLAAQTCQPCPPECAKICKDKSKCTATELKACKAAVASCTPAQVEACKAAGVSCSTTGSAQTLSCKPAGTAPVASCSPADKSTQRVQVVDSKETSRQKNAKLVVSKG